MDKPKIKDLVKDTKALFQCYRDGELWYDIYAFVGDNDHDHENPRGFSKIFSFPVPIADTGNGVFPAEIKAITLMRWIRKHLESMETWDDKN